MEENNDEKEPEIDENGRLIFRLNPTDSALVVRANGGIELISSELAGHENGYLGDIEDLNKTFSLVLALAASIEDEDLYNRIFFNLNKVLMRQWDNLDDDRKGDILKIRKIATMTISAIIKDTYPITKSNIISLFYYLNLRKIFQKIFENECQPFYTVIPPVIMSPMGAN